MTTNTLTMVLHGESGSGKSWTADTAPAPRLVLDAEGGTKFTPSRKVSWTNVNDAPPAPDGTWDTCTVTIRDYRTLQKIFTWLNSGKHPFASVVIDSLSEIQKRLIDEVAGVEQLKMQDWGAVLRKGEALVRSFRDLTMHPSNPVECVVYVCATAESGDHAVYRPQLQGQLRTSLPYFVDVVGFLRVDATETGLVRHMYVQPTNGFLAKDRTGRLGTYVPIRDPRDPESEGGDIPAMLATVYAKEAE